MYIARERRVYVSCFHRAFLNQSKQEEPETATAASVWWRYLPISDFFGVALCVHQLCGAYPFFLSCLLWGLKSLSYNSHTQPPRKRRTKCNVESSPMS